MEQLNKVELRGIVGNVRIQPIGNTRMARLSVATDYGYKSRSGECIIETTWHKVTAFEGAKITALDELGRGDAVHVLGRLRMQRYARPDGTEATCYDILATELHKIDREG